jgi:hypothetical protein
MPFNRYHNPRTSKSGAIDPLSNLLAAYILWADGLGAARGQRSREGPCASHPTRQYFHPLPTHSWHPQRTVLNPWRIHLQMGADHVGIATFRASQRSKTNRTGLCIPLLLLLLQVTLTADARSVLLPSLRPSTIEAFGKYVVQTEAQNAKTLRQGPFLWIDGLPEQDRLKAIAQLKGGQVELLRITKDPSGNNPNVPGGMIHDWEGIIFIPGVKVNDVVKILQDYNHQASYYAPDVEKARIESRNGNDFRIFLRFRRHKVVTVVLDTEHTVTYFRDSAVRAHSRSSATRIAQVEDPGGPNEREKAPGEDDGYLWRMETWWRLEERDGGVYVQNQVVTLTRDIPTGLGWLIEPFITKIPKETLDFTLQATRKAVLSQAQKQQP